MDKKTMLKYVGSMQQLASVRPVSFTEGRAAMKAFLVKNGDLSFTVMADKCLDVGECSYKGTNLNFLAKPGLNGRNQFDTHGGEAQRSIMGGLFFTAGLENICAPCRIDGKEYPMHGRMRTTPAEHAGCDACWDGEDYVITVRGEMREAELFGENMVLRRKIETRYGEKSILVTDEFENQAYRPEPMMLLYHCNIGFPLLDEDCKILLPTKKTMPRDEETASHMDRWCVMDAPKDNETEYIYIHDLAQSGNGNTAAAVINPRKQIGVMVEWNRKYLPNFMEWKSTASGDYVVGFEPSNSSVYGRPYHLEHKNLHMLGSFQKETTWLKFTVLDGQKELDAAAEKISQIMKGEL